MIIVFMAAAVVLITAVALASWFILPGIRTDADARHRRPR